MATQASQRRVLASPQCRLPVGLESRDELFETALPWWHVEPTTVGAYHTATQLPDDRVSIFIDPGAWANLIGEELPHSLAKRAIEAGHRPSQERLETPLRIQGVGQGHQDRAWYIKCPIAAPTDAGPAGLHQFAAPVVRGSGSNLPGLLGLSVSGAPPRDLELRSTGPDPAGARRC